MKYCYECGHITTGEPLFCNSCGRSYDVKLCQRLHVNPRSAEVCSQCGSRDLSSPQPKVSFLWRVFGFLVMVLLGTPLAYASLLFLLALLREPSVQEGLVGLGLLLMALWALWSTIPDWLREVIHHSIKGKAERYRDR